MGKDRTFSSSTITGDGEVRRFRFIFISSLVLFTVIPAGQGLYAQINLSIQDMSVYDDNSFSFYDKRADVYHQLMLTASKDFESDYANLQLFYYPALVLFRTYDTRTYHQHTLGAWYVLQLDHRDSDEEEKEEEKAEGTEEEEIESEQDSTAFEEEESKEDSTEASMKFIDQRQNTHQDNDLFASKTLNRKSRNVFRDFSRHANRRPAKRKNFNQSIDSASSTFSDSLVTYLHVKPLAKGRFDKPEFEFYDFRAGALELMLRRHLFADAMARVQYEIEYKSLPRFRQFTHIEQNIIFTLNAQVSTWTELFGAIDFGYKNYTESTIDTTFIVNGSGGKGKGKGGVKPPKRVISEFSTPSTSQYVLAAGVVQKISNASSFTLSYLRRINPKNQARFINRTNIVGTSEGEIFDDRYGYESHEIDVHFTSLLFKTLRMEGAVELHRKVYPRIAADEVGNTLPGDPQRVDNRFGFQFHVMYPFLKSSTGGNFISLGGKYTFYHNQSNDRYHDYNIHQGAVVVEVEF